MFNKEELTLLIACMELTNRELSGCDFFEEGRLFFEELSKKISLMKRD